MQVLFYNCTMHDWTEQFPKTNWTIWVTQLRITKHHPREENLKENWPGESQFPWWEGHQALPYKPGSYHLSRTMQGTSEGTCPAFSPMPQPKGSLWQTLHPHKPCYRKSEYSASGSPNWPLCNRTGCDHTSATPSPNSQSQRKCHHPPSQTTSHSPSQASLSPTQFEISEPPTPHVDSSPWTTLRHHLILSMLVRGSHHQVQFSLLGLATHCPLFRLASTIAWCTLFFGSIAWMRLLCQTLCGKCWFSRRVLGCGEVAEEWWRWKGVWWWKEGKAFLEDNRMNEWWIQGSRRSRRWKPWRRRRSPVLLWSMKSESSDLDPWGCCSWWTESMVSRVFS